MNRDHSVVIFRPTFLRLKFEQTGTHVMPCILVNSQLLCVAYTTIDYECRHSHKIDRETCKFLAGRSLLPCHDNSLSICPSVRGSVMLYT